MGCLLDDFFVLCHESVDFKDQGHELVVDGEGESWLGEFLSDHGSNPLHPVESFFEVTFETRSTEFMQFLGHGLGMSLSHFLLQTFLSILQQREGGAIQQQLVRCLLLKT